jgi:HAMP domain-containing protein
VGLNVTPSVVASVAHMLVFLYGASTLLRGAKTFERRQLGWAFAFFALYSASIGLAFALPLPIEVVPDALCLVFATEGVARLAALAPQLRKTPGPARVALWSRALVAVSAFSAIVTIAQLWSGRSALTSEAVTALALLAAFLVTIGSFARAMLSWGSDPRRIAPRSFMIACGWALVPLIPYTVQFAGISVPNYMIFRDVTIIALAFALVAAMLDHSRESITLQLRFSMGTLTLVLSALVIATEAIVHAEPDPVRARMMSMRMLAIVVFTETVVVVAFPLLYRRSLIGPLQRLLEGVKSIEAGSLDVRVEVARDDEIGTLSASFNRMVVSLKETNEELRRQIAARSRDLAEVLEENPTNVQVGETIDDRYLVTRFVGSGGMGIVYAAERVHDKKPLAIKIMVGTTEREDAARFAREAEIASQLQHPNLVSVLDVGVYKGNAYLVMDLVDGGSLEEQRARFGDVEWAVPIIRQIARGLAALHAGGVVHRDLKPGNVLLGKSSEAKITDFGIARQEGLRALASTIGVEAPTARAGLTRTGALMGTLPYMAPELGRGSKTATSAADVFALGLVAHELLTGRLPFDMPPIMLAMAGRSLEPVPTLPGHVPAALAAKIASCLRAEPTERPTAADVAQLV